MGVTSLSQAFRWDSLGCTNNSFHLLFSKSDRFWLWSCSLLKCEVITRILYLSENVLNQGGCN